MLAAFTASLLLITISELGDKTFFIAVILAMRNSRRLVFLAVIAALVAMTLLSVGMGQFLALMPKIYIHWGEVSLFLGFGLKLLYDASKMSDSTGAVGEKEAEIMVEECDQEKNQFWLQFPQVGFLCQAFLMTFIAEWGDRTQISTVALAASYEPISVISGSILGHSICTAIAVIGGRLIAGHISERIVTAVGGFLFLIFGIVTLVQNN